MTTEILTLPELSVYLRVSKQTAYKLVQRGRIPSFKLGRQLRFRKAMIDAWIEKNEQARAQRMFRKRRGVLLDAAN